MRSMLNRKSVRAAYALTALALLAACVKRADTPRDTAPRPFQLLAQAAERETTQIEQRRADVEIETHDYDRTPHVVAVGETPLIHLDGARARLFGDQTGKEGWSVDNFVLIEVVDEKGKVINRGA